MTQILQEKILELLPEIDDLEDNTLRERVIATWLAAAKRGGWKAEELEDIPFTLLLPEAPYNLFQHTRAVTRTALAIAKAMQEVYGDSLQVNEQVLIAAGLLHDVGKLLEYERSPDGVTFVTSRSGKLLRHPLSGAVLAGELGVPEEILHIIAGHSREGEPGPRTLEGAIINHADFVNFDSVQALKV